MRQLTRLLGYIRPYLAQFFASVVLMAAVGAMEAFRILLVGPIFDKVLHPATQANDITLFPIPGTSRFVYLQQFVNYAGFGLITDLRNRLYQSILHRSVGFFSRNSTGTLVSTVINDVEKVQFALSSVMAEFLQQFFTLIFTAMVAVVLGGRLAWILVLFVPFVIFSAGRIGRKVRSTTRKGQDKLADIQNILHESITGNRIVKAFTMERWESQRFFEAARNLFKANMRSVRAQALSSPLMDIIGYVAIALLIWIGRNQIKSDAAFSAGRFVGFIIAVFKLYDPVRKFAVFNNSFQQALGASSEIFRYMDEEEEIKEKPGAAALSLFRESVRFEDVSFSYSGENGQEARILRNINLEVRAGEVIAIVGSSGAGKSTLVQLIPRFFDVTSGAIKIDGHDIRDLTLNSLRAQIGIVTQETILFNDTVRNNIAYGQPDVTVDAVMEAAKVALAHDFIERLPEGYDTIIGEKGLRLSGGERQRIAIARALLKNAPILILDEATSALDNESEALVQAALHNLITGRTVFVIAHRLTTIRRVDRIVVLENGHITDTGVAAREPQIRG
jgi:subfamily B ATP-binding cassette protein MsbA